MKVLQLNIWTARVGKPIFDLLEQENADIICFQEMLSLGFDLPSMMGAPLEELQAKLNYKYSFYSPVFSFRIMNRVGKWGNCILSRQKLLNSEVIFTNLEHVEDFNFEEYDYNIRNLQHAVVRIKNQDVHILNHHGHQIPEHKKGDANTLRQMKIIGDYIDKLSGPIIMCGDFNLFPKSESLEIINKRLSNLSVKYRLKTTRTPLTHKTEVCDYIFVSKDIKVNDFYASEQIVSDHKALVLDFDI